MSVPRRFSFVLAAVGVAAFWGQLIWFLARDVGYDVQGMLLLAAGFLFAVACHIVGLVMVLAVPPGRRMLPALFNAAPLALFAAALFYRFVVKG